jgi:hypothetical protein
MPGLKWPVTSNELRDAGYEYDNDGACKGCQAPIEWWISPAGAKTPMSIISAAERNPSIQARMKDPLDKRQPHFIDCVERDKFKRR